MVFHSKTPSFDLFCFVLFFGTFTPLTALLYFHHEKFIRERLQNTRRFTHTSNNEMQGLFADIHINKQQLLSRIDWIHQTEIFMAPCRQPSVLSHYPAMPLQTVRFGFIIASHDHAC